MLDLRVYIKERWMSFNLPDDISISIEENSPVWDTAASTFSEEFDIPVEPNIHILGNLESMRSDDVYKLLYGCKFQLYACGVLFRSGVIHLDDELDVEYDERTDTHSISIELVSSKQELSEILDGVNCQDLPISEDNIQIGYANSEELYLDVKFGKAGEVDEEGYNFIGISPAETKTEYKYRTISAPRIMIPSGYMEGMDGYENNDFVNSSHPYDPSMPTRYPYCNIKLCHQHYIKENENSYAAQRSYDVADVDRINTSPCIYVGYFLHKVFSTVYSTKNGPISIDVKSNALNNIPDFLRLAFFHSSCEYDEVPVIGREGIMPFDISNKSYDAYLSFEADYKRAIRFDAFTYGAVIPEELLPEKWYEQWHPLLRSSYYEYNRLPREYYSSDDGIDVAVHAHADECRAILNAKNLPDQDVMSVIEALQNAFNARFIYDSNGSVMSIVLVSDILSQTDCIDIPCEITNVYQTQNNKRGFRLKYNSAQEIYENPITHKQVLIGTKEDKNGSSVDTTYNYNDYTRVIAFDSYNTVLSNITPYTMDLFLDKHTGNAYRIKVDKDAKEAQKLYPSTFEVGGYGDVEYGDCSDNDFVEEVTIGFNPAIPNDTNASKEMEAAKDNTGENVTPEFAQFVDVELHRHQRGDLGSRPDDYPEELVNFDIMLKQGEASPHKFTPIGHTYYSYSEGMNLKVSFFAKDSYNFADHEVHPYNSVDSGFTLGILRDSDAVASKTNVYNVNYDGEDTSEWSENKMNSTGGFTSDSFDQYGNLLCVHPATEKIYVNKSNVSALIDKYFPNANVDLRSPYRRCGKEKMHAAGYTNFSGDYATYYSSSKWYTVSPGKEAEVLYTPITDKGNVNTKSYCESRLQAFSESVTSGYDIIHIEKELSDETFALPMIIGIYDSPQEADLYAKLLHVLGEVYYDDSANIEQVAYVPIKGKTSKSLSLKLKAEKKNPYYDPATKTCSRYQELTDLDTGYFQVDPQCARRGLFDNFYEEYAYWVVNRRIAHITAVIELAELVGIDFTKKYKFGEYVGFIKSISYSISKDGLSPVDIELYYL